MPSEMGLKRPMELKESELNKYWKQLNWNLKNWLFNFLNNYPRI